MPDRRLHSEPFSYRIYLLIHHIIQILRIHYNGSPIDTYVQRNFVNQFIIFIPVTEYNTFITSELVQNLKILNKISRKSFL